MLTEKNKIIVDGKTFYTETAANLYINNKKPKSSLQVFLYSFLIIFFLLLVGSMLLTPSYSFNMNIAFWGGVKHSLIITSSVMLGEFLFRKFRKIKLNHPSSEMKKSAYLKALEEIESNSMDKFCKAQAIEKSKGDESKINSIYITLRTKNLVVSNLKD